jgi:hypothetical protein
MNAIEKTELKSDQLCDNVAGTMSSGQPLWLQVVHRLERAVGEPVESAVHSDAYFDVMAQMTRARSQLTVAVEGLSRRCLHLVNLPAGTDVRRVREQLARMERRLNALSEEIAALEDVPGRAG